MPCDDPTDPKSTHANLSHGHRLLEVAALFTRLGFTAFGGPAAHVAMMEQEVVVRRRWLSRQEFLDAYAAINFIPGPNSTELAIYLGSVRAGFAGLLTAGFCFILPAMLIILPIAWAYVRYGQIAHVKGMMVGVNAAVVAIVAAACFRFAATTLRTGFEKFVAAGAFAGAAVLIYSHVGQADLIVLAAAALIGVVRHLATQRKLSTGGLPLFAVPLPSLAASTAASAAPASGGLLQLAGLFLKIGATLFGSGYVLVSYLQNSVVDQYHWMNRDQLLSAISVGQFTPGPLLTTATFIGYYRGWQIFGNIPGAIAGAVIATAAIFAPAFVLIALFGRFLPRLRKNPWARAALDAVNAAVVSLIAIASMRLGIAALVQPGWRTVIPEILPIAVFGTSLLALIRFNVNATWMILLGAAAGLAV